MKKLTSMLEDELLTPRSGPVPYGRKKQFPVAKMMPLLAATFMFAMAGATLGQGGGEPASVLYWDGSSLNVIGPTSGYLIPAGATYAIDEVAGVALLLATLPDPTTSVPSITTPSGVTFQIPDAGNVASVVQNGGSVTVTYNDGSTATVPGTLLPPGSPVPPPAPAETPSGPVEPPGPPPDLAPLENALVNDAWIPDFLGFQPTDTMLPSDTDLKDNLFDGSVGWTTADQSGEMTLTTPEPSSLALLGIGAVSLLVCDWRRRMAKA